MSFSNSPLVSHINISPNKTSGRNKTIDRITPHCVVGQCSVETLGNIFAPTSRQASSNYGIGVDGRIGMYCEEKDRSWCSSSGANDHRAVTIECASDTKHPYEMNETVYQSLINLCADICARNGKSKLLWLGDKNKTLAYNPAADEMILTVHRWFANKSCPGDWLFSRLGDLAEKVTEKLNAESITDTAQPPAETPTTPAVFNVGDVVKFNGNVHYTSANAANGKACKSGKAKITQIYQLGKAKHPYHLVRESGGSATVWGWVDEKDVSEITAAAPAAKYSPAVGDAVKINSGVTAYSNGVKMPAWVRSATLYIRQIEKNGTILLVSTEKTKKVYTGRVKASDVHKA